MKFTWVIMSHANKTADKSVEYNLNNAGEKIDEIIWVDNNTVESPLMEKIADRIIRNKMNVGIAKGYNPAFAMAKGDFIIITGSDTRMPNNWLKVYKEHIKKIPNTGVACMCNVHYTQAKERIRGKKEVINGLEIVPALPLGFRVINKQIIKDCGYLREDFGMYGWDDVEWAERILKHTTLKTYIIPDYIPEHDVFHQPDKDYFDFKLKETKDPKKEEKLRWCRENNYPIYNPYV